MTFIHILIAAMGVGRIAIGLGPFVAAGPLSRVIGFPASHDNPTARLMARMFGSRDIGLGVLTFYALGHAEILPFVMVFQASMDAADLVSISLPLVRRDGIDRGALRSAAFAITGMVGWLVVSAL